MQIPRLMPILCFILLVIGMSIFTLGWSKWTLLSSVQQQYAQTYEHLTPSKIYTGSGDDESTRFIINKMTQELSGFLVTSPVSVLGQCGVHQISARYGLIDSARWIHRGTLKLVLEDPYHHLNYVGDLDCRINWGILLLSQTLIAALLWALIVWLPKPLGAEATALIGRLEQHGWSKRHAKQLGRLSPEIRKVIDKIYAHPALSEMDADNVLLLMKHYQLVSISAHQLDWLAVNFRHGQNEDKSFFNVFAMTPQLTFNVDQRLLSINGIAIKLTSTPYYYYLWYAQKRQHGGEQCWVVNPLTTKADTTLGAELILLMQQNGGHGKAINDLVRNGLTAKKLDQNRNKIKDEIIAVLGEELAAPYLFEARREATSQRYSYRIALQSEKIKIK